MQYILALISLDALLNSLLDIPMILLNTVMLVLLLSSLDIDSFNELTLGLTLVSPVIFVAYLVLLEKYAPYLSLDLKTLYCLCLYKRGQKHIATVREMMLY